MRRVWLAVTALSLLTAACSAGGPPPIPTSAPPPSAPPEPTATAVPATQQATPTSVPTATSTPVTLLDPAALGPFAEMPDNEAVGDLAPDFTARAMGDWSFALIAQRGSYVLLVPTAIGCGECVFALRELGAAYLPYQGQGLKVVVLNLYSEDPPEAWAYYAELYPEQDFIWAVVDSTDFVVEYRIRTLGTTLLVDPDGRLVYRRGYPPLRANEFQRLFELALVGDSITSQQTEANE